MFKKKTEFDFVERSTVNSLLQSIGRMMTSLDINSARISDVNRDLITQITLIVKLQKRVAELEEKVKP